MTIIKPQSPGFTLIEMLVVLVILGITTTLLSEGLSNTWRNFEKLSSRDSLSSTAQLPVNWFAQSVSGAVLYHPYNPVVHGTDNRFEFISNNVPHDAKHIPQSLTWFIQAEQNLWTLSYLSEFTAQPVKVKRFSQPTYFEYLQEGSWQTSFAPEDSRLPRAVRIKTGEQVFVIAQPSRPEIADMPPELLLFGQYEF
ncbi:PulJ/GspJ family protein [Paraglaciecola aestuariivivens]